MPGKSKNYKCKTTFGGQLYVPYSARSKGQGGPALKDIRLQDEEDKNSAVKLLETTESIMSDFKKNYSVEERCCVLQGHIKILGDLKGRIKVFIKQGRYVEANKLSGAWDRALDSFGIQQQANQTEVSAAASWGEVPEADAGWGAVPEADAGWGAVPEADAGWGAGAEAGKDWGAGHAVEIDRLRLLQTQVDAEIVRIVSEHDPLLNQVLDSLYRLCDDIGASLTGQNLTSAYDCESIFEGIKEYARTSVTEAGFDHCDAPMGF